MGVAIVLDKHEMVIDRDEYYNLCVDAMKLDFIRKHQVELRPETTWWIDTEGKRYKPDYGVSIDNIAFFGQNLDDALQIAMSNECGHCGRIYDHLPGCIGELLTEGDANEQLC